jgi:hypothetical protein
MLEFDSDAFEGSRLLLSGPADPAQADDVREWAAEQSARLSGLRSTIPAQDKADESLALLDRLLSEASAQAACDPAEGPCPTVIEGDPLDGADETGSTRRPDAVVPGTPEPRTTTRGGTGTDDPADDTTPADDERTTPGGSSDDEPADDDNRDRSGGSGGSGGGDAAGSEGELSVPLPLPAPVKVPSVAPGLPGVSLGG